MRCLSYGVMFAIAAAGCKTPDQSTVKTNARPPSAANTVNVDSDFRAESNPSHFEGDFTVAGPYVLNDASIQSRYSTTAKRYGTFRLQMSNPANPQAPGPFWADGRGHIKYLRELHYPLGDGSVGIRPFVVAEPDEVAAPSPAEPYTNFKLFSKDPTGNEARLIKRPVAVATVSGETVTPTGETYEATRLNELDDYLMNMTPGQKLDSTWEIYAVTTYMHPEEPQASMEKLGGMKLKLQGAYSHMGNYHGRGRTRNSPFGYEAWKIWDSDQGGSGTKYPVDIYQVRIKGTHRKETNITARQINTILNGDGRPFGQNVPDKDRLGPPTVDFPQGGYEFDWFSLDSVANNLHFFAAWIDPEYPVTTNYKGKTIKWVDLVKVPEFANYCAEHVTGSLNVALNLPFNEADFVKAYASVPVTATATAPSGKQGRPNTPAPAVAAGQYGKKLYKLAQARFEQLAGYPPVETHFTPLHEIDFAGKDPLTSPELTAPNNGLVWPLQSTIDFIANYLEQYLSWVDVGAIASSGALLQLYDQTHGRINIDQAEYFGTYAIPVIAEMVAAEAKTKVFTGLPLQAYQTAIEGGFASIIKDATMLANVTGAVKARLAAFGTSLDTQAAPMATEKAWDEFRAAIQPIIEKGQARKLNCDNDTKCVKWYSSPAIMHRLAIGIHKPNKNVIVEVVGTLFDPVDLYRVKGGDANSKLVYKMDDKP